MAPPEHALASAAEGSTLADTPLFSWHSLSGKATGVLPVAKVAGKAPAVHARAVKEPPSTTHFHRGRHGLIMAAVTFLSQLRSAVLTVLTRELLLRCAFDGQHRAEGDQA